MGIRSERKAEYQAWIDMRRRCYNPKNAAYEWYGGRGITVCNDWQSSFAAFFEHIGPRPSADHSLDRIDVNLGYAPGNVRWATRKDQNNNRSNSRKMEYGGRVLTVAEVAEMIGDASSKRMIQERLASGWSPERAAATKKMSRPEFSKLGRPPAFTYRGEATTMSAAIERSGVGISRETVRQRMRRQGWDLERAIHTPIDTRMSRAR